ncbi:MAG: PqqD family protein [Acidobacteria bacterium]|nr:PqqD family protein [Acidobacteriota bacterium]
MKNSHNPIARKSGLVIQEMPGEVLVYDLDRDKAHCLNESAALVWQSCDGSNSVQDIVRRLEESSRGKVNEDLVWLALDQLNENDLLEAGTGTHFKGQSRREVLKKIGLASVVALPVIASLVTPQSVMAAGSCACTTNAQCAPLTACPSQSNCNNGVCAP